MNNILEKLKTTRLLAGIGIVCMILGTMCAYVTINFLGYVQEIALWSYVEGKLLLLIAVANLLFIFKDVVEKYVPSVFNTGIGKKIKDINNPKASLVPTLIGAAIAIYLTSDIETEFAKYDLGFYLMWIGVICLVAYALLYKKNDDSQM